MTRRWPSCSCGGRCVPASGSRHEGLAARCRPGCGALAGPERQAVAALSAGVHRQRSVPGRGPPSRGSDLAAGASRAPRGDGHAARHEGEAMKPERIAELKVLLLAGLPKLWSMPIDVDRLFSDPLVAAMGPVTDGIYIKLLLRLWQRQGWLPWDDAVIARTLGL